MAKEYDLVVLGGGPGGYVAAIRASQLGMKVALVEKEKVGGTCLHHGCIPAKAILRSAEMYRQVQEAATFGIEVANITVNFEEAVNRKDHIIQKLYEGILSILKRESVDVYHGFGRILGASIFSPQSGTISVEYNDGRENTMLVPKYVIIATGSKHRTLPQLDTDGKYILNSDHLMDLKQLPKSMLIIGGGVIGTESASMLQDLGVQVTIIDSKDILPYLDHDIQKELKKGLKRRGVNFLTDSIVHPETVEIKQNEVTLEITKDGERRKVSAEKVLLAIGREPNTDEIGLQNTAVEVEHGAIVVNEMYQTKESHIYAIGDCIGGMQLAHVASKEGIIAVEHIAGLNPTPLDETLVPSCIYSYPEVAQIGLSEQEAKAQGFDVKVGKFPLQANGKAHINGDTVGFIKVVANRKTDDILGVHMIGANVSELISEASLAKTLDASTWEITQTIHPHPTISESVFEAALAVDGKQIHS